MHENLSNQGQQIADLWAEIHFKTSDRKVAAKYLQKYPLFNEIARQTNQVFMISSLKSLGMMAVSDNYNDILEYGISMEDVLKWSFLYFSKAVPFSQNKAMIQISYWYKTQKKQLIEDPEYHQAYCGWKFKSNVTGKTKFLMTTGLGLEYGKNGEPIILMSTISDISHLLHEDAPFWSTIGLEKSNRFQYLFHSNKSGLQEGKILSSREIEFLKAFESGLELKDIALRLNISYKTADTHRSNILARTGARNVMAAIEISKKIGLI